MHPLTIHVAKGMLDWYLVCWIHARKKPTEKTNMTEKKTLLCAE